MVVVFTSSGVGHCFHCQWNLDHIQFILYTQTRVFLCNLMS